MNIQTEENFCGLDKKSPLSKNFNILRYEDGSMSTIPHGFFRDWLDNDLLDAGFGDFYIGRCSGVGVGSVVKYDTATQSLKIGRYVAGGLRLKFILNGQHDMESISIAMLSFLADGLKNTPVPQYQDTVIKNDVWIGDEAMFLGGSVVENGCVIGARSLLPPNFKSEPYGVYVGSPARLVRFRFSEKIRELLLQLEWWNMPLNWLRVENDKFLLNLARMAEGAAIDVLQGLIESKKQMLKKSRG
ncbi:acetyltransferase [Comamonas aquatica]|uniref:acetyltransferase n=1 Tax=Comamonas aquatica TaxID=225991 RepID=UPI0005A778FD|nr:acetyltransferase [Comamonas aquatica]QTX20899.1 acetyltransferase [Comamonas aquatica]